MTIEPDAPKFDIEIGENCKPSICHCCEHKSNIGHGFVYKDGNAYAIYYAGWSPSHSYNKVSIAIAIGGWSDNSTSADRICFGLESYEAEKEILFRVIDPVESPWSNTELLGKMISRQDALNNSLLKEVFVIAERVVCNHDAIRKYLGITQ